LLNCQDEIVNSWDKCDEENINDATAEAAFREKYQIPASVHLFYEAEKTLAREVEQWIKPFAAGRLTEDLITSEIIAEAMEINEYDYAWVFLGVHANFYEVKDGIDIKEADREIIEIGSRSKTKSRACNKWQAWYDDILMNSIIKDRWGALGYKYTRQMYIEDYAACNELFNKAEVMDYRIAEKYNQEMIAIRKSKHPLPKNWEAQVSEANRLFDKYRNWKDYDPA